MEQKKPPKKYSLDENMLWIGYASKSKINYEKNVGLTKEAITHKGFWYRTRPIWNILWHNQKKGVGKTTKENGSFMPN